MLNRCEFIGRLGKDPELKTTSGGTAICKFSLAATERWSGKDGGKQERTEWVRCTAFDRLAQICGEILRKGDLVFVEGKMSTSKYQKDGQEHYSTEIVLTRMQTLMTKADRGDQPQEPAAQMPRQDPVFGDDDVPF